MLWALKRTVSMRRFFLAPKTYMFELMGKKIFTFYAENFCLSKPEYIEFVIYVTYWQTSNTTIFYTRNDI